MRLPDRIARAAGTLTPREKALADALVAAYPHGLLDSATDIARQGGISASTVVRFFAKLGYPAFADAQREARAALSAAIGSPVQRAGVALRRDHDVAALLDDAFLVDRDNLEATRAGLDPQAFDAMARALARTGGRLFLVGDKNSQVVAQYLHAQLNLCRPDVHLLDTQQSMFADSLVWLNDKDTMLVISIRRYAKRAVQAARHLHALGGTVLAITDGPLAPIAALATHRAQVRTAGVSPFDSYTAAFCLANALVAAVAQRRGKSVERTIARADALWREFGTFVEHDGGGD